MADRPEGVPEAANLVPDAVYDYWRTKQACENLVERYVKLPFGYKRACRAATDAVKAQDRFWLKLYKLYPHLSKGSDPVRWELVEGGCWVAYSKDWPKEESDG